MSLAEIFRSIKKSGEDPLKLVNTFFKEQDPVHRMLGLEVTRLDEGYAEAVFEYREELSRVGGMVHGGVIMTSIDQVGGMAVMTVNNRRNQVTMELKTNFTKPLTRENSPYRVRARVLHRGSRTVVVEVVVEDGEGSTAAVAVGTWFLLD